MRKDYSRTGRRTLMRGIGLLAGEFVATQLAPAGQAQATVPIIDAQSHPLRSPHGKAPLAVGEAALRLMDRLNVQATILAPPPFPPNRRPAYGLTDLQALARQWPQRFGFNAGGDSLNPMIQGTSPERVSAATTQSFVALAREIAEAGAAGFGELAVEHFSSGGHQPYESSPADHPLFLALADVAAQYGMPVTLHMEAVPGAMPFPADGLSGGGGALSPNPARLKENISGLERLLDHNPAARIVWLHSGWDLTGERTVSLMRRLLGRHRNLFMTVKSDHHGKHPTAPFLPGFKIKPAWLKMLHAFPDRFAVGSDQFFNEPPERLERARKLIDALPPDLAQLVGRKNVRHIYRVPAWT